MVLNFTDPFLTTRVLGFETLFDRLQRLSESSDRSSYPPYNIRRNENLIYIDLAVAGLSKEDLNVCLLYTSPSPRDLMRSRMPSSA